MVEGAVKLSQKSLVELHRTMLISAVLQGEQNLVCHNVTKGVLGKTAQHVQNIKGLFSIQRITMGMKCPVCGINIKRLNNKWRFEQDYKRPYVPY